MNFGIICVRGPRCSHGLNDKHHRQAGKCGYCDRMVWRCAPWTRLPSDVAVHASCHAKRQPGLPGVLTK